MEPPQDHRTRRTLLNAAIIIGLLTMGATAAGNLVNLLSGRAAMAFAVAGAVLAGAAAIVTVLVSVPSATSGRADPVDGGDTAPSRATPARPAIAATTPGPHPLAVIRDVRLPLAVLLAPLGVLLAADHHAVAAPLALLTFPIVFAAAAATHYFEYVRDADGRARQRGTGFAATAVYASAAGLGFWQVELNGTGFGLLSAALVLIGGALTLGLIEDDIRRYGPLALLLPAAAVAGVVMTAHETSDAWDFAALVGVLAAAAVVVPAGLRGRFYDWPGGLAEFVPLPLGVLLAVFDDALWMVAAAGVFAMSLAYSWQFRQDRISVLYARGRLSKIPMGLKTFAVLGAVGSGALGVMWLFWMYW